MALVVSITAVTTLASAQQHAHTHGRLELNAAIDAKSITLQIESPLDSFLGFERAPRTAAERSWVAEMVARLNTADRLFQPDPAAACKRPEVELSSAALGLGDASAQAGQQHDHAGDDEHEHADIDITVVFQCAKASTARYINVKLFDAFEGVRVIEAQVASPQGQFKRTLTAGSTRLAWGR